MPDADERFLRVREMSDVSSVGRRLSVCRNASVDGFRLFQRLRLSKNQNILPGGDRRTAAARTWLTSSVFVFCVFDFFITGRKQEIPDADERLLRVPGK